MLGGKAFYSVSTKELLQRSMLPHASLQRLRLRQRGRKTAARAMSRRWSARLPMIQDSRKCFVSAA